MRYRIGKAQIQMLLDGKALQAGREKVYVLPETEVYTELKKLTEDPYKLARVAVFTDGVTIFVEDKE